TWIDCLAEPAQTFRYTAKGAEGLCGPKRIIVGSSRGGFYSAPSDHQESYLTGFFGFLGVSDIAFVRAEGVNLGAEQRARALEAALAEVTTLKAAGDASGEERFASSARDAFMAVLLLRVVLSGCCRDHEVRPSPRGKLRRLSA